MTYADICSYPEQSFHRYWKQIINDPHFRDLLKSFFIQQQAIERAKAIGKAAMDIPFEAGSRLGAKIGAKGFAAYHAALLKLKSFRSWSDFQNFMVYMVQQVLDRTTQGFSFGGLDYITKEINHRGICFLSSHRSTFLDPALANYTLYKTFGKTAHNAAGDNIFKTTWLGHLIRLNKGFMVKREVEDMDEKLLEAQKLSGYIKDITEKQKWVWIAHRNGRAKDGKDMTDSAVLSMLKMAHEDRNWEEFSQETAYMPIAMSWEHIPLDDLMAQELNGITLHSGTHRDMMNIITEIRIPKRRIHLQFCEPAHGVKRTELVKSLDHQIHSNTKLWESNWVAYLELLRAQDPQQAQKIHNQVSTQVDLSQGQWVLKRAAEQGTIVSQGIEDGTLDCPQNFCEDQDLVHKSSQWKANQMGHRVSQSLLAMYAAPVELALKAQSEDLIEVLQTQALLG
jgi:hypothetical protein